MADAFRIEFVPELSRYKQPLARIHVKLESGKPLPGPVELEPAEPAMDPPDYLHALNPRLDGEYLVFTAQVSSILLQKKDFNELVKDPINFTFHAKTKPFGKKRRVYTLKGQATIQIDPIPIKVDWKTWPEDKPDKAVKGGPVTVQPDGKSGTVLYFWVWVYKGQEGWKYTYDDYDFCLSVDKLFDDGVLSLGTGPNAGAGLQQSSTFRSTMKLPNPPGYPDLPVMSTIRVKVYRKGRITGWNPDGSPQTDPPGAPPDKSLEIPLQVDYPDLMFSIDMTKYGWEDQSIYIHRDSPDYKDLYFDLFDPGGVTMVLDVRARYTGPTGKADFNDKELLWPVVHADRSGDSPQNISSPNSDGRIEIVWEGGAKRVKVKVADGDQMELKDDTLKYFKPFETDFNDFASKANCFNAELAAQFTRYAPGFFKPYLELPGETTDDTESIDTNEEKRQLCAKNLSLLLFLSKNSARQLETSLTQRGAAAGNVVKSLLGLLLDGFMGILSHTKAGKSLVSEIGRTATDILEGLKNKVAQLTAQIPALEQAIKAAEDIAKLAKDAYEGLKSKLSGMQKEIGDLEKEGKQIADGIKATEDAANTVKQLEGDLAQLERASAAASDAATKAEVQLNEKLAEQTARSTELAAATAKADQAAAAAAGLPSMKGQQSYLSDRLGKIQEYLANPPDVATPAKLAQLQAYQKQYSTLLEGLNQKISAAEQLAAQQAGLDAARNAAEAAAKNAEDEVTKARTLLSANKDAGSQAQKAVDDWGRNNSATLAQNRQAATAGSQQMPQWQQRQADIGSQLSTKNGEIQQIQQQLPDALRESNTEASAAQQIRDAKNAEIAALNDQIAKQQAEIDKLLKDPSAGASAAQVADKLKQMKNEAVPNTLWGKIKAFFSAGIDWLMGTAPMRWIAQAVDAMLEKIAEAMGKLMACLEPMLQCIQPLIDSFHTEVVKQIAFWAGGQAADQFAQQPFGNRVLSTSEWIQDPEININAPLPKEAYAAKKALLIAKATSRTSQLNGEARLNHGYWTNYAFATAVDHALQYQVLDQPQPQFDQCTRYVERIENQLIRQAGAIARGNSFMATQVLTQGGYETALDFLNVINWMLWALSWILRALSIIIPLMTGGVGLPVGATLYLLSDVNDVLNDTLYLMGVVWVDFIPKEKTAALISLCPAIYFCALYATTSAPDTTILDGIESLDPWAAVDQANLPKTAVPAPVTA